MSLVALQSTFLGVAVWLMALSQTIPGPWATQLSLTGLWTWQRSLFLVESSSNRNTSSRAECSWRNLQHRRRLPSLVLGASNHPQHAADDVLRQSLGTKLGA